MTGFRLFFLFVLAAFLQPLPPELAYRFALQGDDTGASVDQAPIDSTNYSQLTQVAQLGKGLLLAAAFAPDGESFVVGSMWGLARFKTSDPESPPRWIPFETPYSYDNLTYSRDGYYILLGQDHDKYKYQIRSAIDGRLFSQVQYQNVEWLPSTERMGYEQTDTIVSPDGQLLFRSIESYLLNNVEIIVSERYILEAGSLNVLHKLPDKTFYKYYRQMREPEGCDMRYFAIDANAFYPQAYRPYRAAFSPSSRLLAVFYSMSLRPSGVLRLYDTATGEIVERIGGLENPVATFAFAPTEDNLVVGFQNGTILIWNIEQGETHAFRWQFAQPVYDLHYTPDSQHLIRQKANAIEVLRVSDWAKIQEYAGTAFALSPSGDRLAVGDRDGVIRVVEPVTGHLIYTIPAHTAKVYALAFSQDGKSLVSSGRDCSVRAWNMMTGQYWHSFEENGTDPGFGRPSRVLTWYLEFAPAGDRLLGLGSWGRISGWNVNNGATVYVTEPEPLEYYNGMITAKPHFPMDFALQSDDTFFLGNVHYEAQTGERIGEYVAPAELPEDCILSGPVTTDGKVRFTIGVESRNGQICILDETDFSLLQTIEVLPSSAASAAPIYWLYLSPNGAQLIVNLYEGAMLVYEVPH